MTAQADPNYNGRKQTMEKRILVKQISDAVNGDESFCKALLSVEDAASAQAILKENGIDASLQDVEGIFKDGVSEIVKYKEASQAADGELDENQLANVAGGGIVRGVLRTSASAAGAFGFGMICGVCPAASVATPYVVGGLTAWSAAGYFKEGW